MNIGLELKSVMNLIVRYTHKLSELQNISMQQAAIIKYLMHHQNEDINSKDLEIAFSMRGSTCSRMLTTMEQNDLIMRIDDQNDSRKKIIKPTEKSIRFISSIKDKFDEMEEKIKQNITLEDLEIFKKVIEQIKQNITLEDEV
ncbi:MarR family winged helix-turn-helix transcriptional regulator [Acholeplasma granularum]|uniref:MarR family winged helix-turn-helix transcriptional regulator n=1 Tax=Acholeplasma granularum TaxID=264635 RepID=UPI00046EF051|nr:MarR family transcriptional regulator [Acholeplasma granularum]